MLKWYRPTVRTGFNGREAVVTIKGLGRVRNIHQFHPSIALKQHIHNNNNNVYVISTNFTPVSLHNNIYRTTTTTTTFW